MALVIGYDRLRSEGEFINYWGIDLYLDIIHKGFNLKDKPLNIFNQLQEKNIEHKNYIEFFKKDRFNNINKERQDIKEKLRFHRTQFINNPNIDYKDVCKTEKIIDELKDRYYQLGKELSGLNQTIQYYENKIKENNEVIENFNKRFKEIWDKELPPNENQTKKTKVNKL